MKMKLSKSLLALVLSTIAAGTAAQAATEPLRPYYVHTEGGDITESIKGYQGQLSQADDRAQKAGAYVKDGANEASITGDITMDTRLIVREGTVKMSNATITQKSDGEYDFLVVGGKKVNDQTTTLELDNSKVVQTDKDWGGYMKTVTVGNKDGEGALVLKNSSFIQSGQLFHIGYSDYVNACHGSYTTADTSDKTTYFTSETPGHGHVSLEGGSRIYAGQGLRGGDMTLEISGADSAFIVGSRAIKLTETINSTRLGHIAGTTSTVEIKDGGAMENYNQLYMSRVSATSEVNVSGKDSLFAGYSTSLVADQADTSAKVTLSATDGGRIHLTDATMGATGGNNEVTVTIDETSSYTGSSLTINEGTTMSNDGEVSLTPGEKTTMWRDDRNIGLEASLADYENARYSKGEEYTSADVDSALTMNGGTFTNNGTLSVDTITMNGGELILGEGATLELTLDDTAALIFGDGSLELAANTTLVNVKLIVNSISTFSMRAETVDFVLASGNTQSVDAFYEMLESEGVQVTFEDTEGTELSGYSLDRNEQGQLVVTESVPEPTTATLSLLALAGLAARRRRR